MALLETAWSEERTAMLLRDAVDDTDEAPWMTMPEFQALVIALLAGILRLHARRRGLGWHVSTELGVQLRKPAGQGTLTLGPDLFVVEADAALRNSWDILAERQPPRFVLEVVTKDSVTRDTGQDHKVAYYAAMGVEEYAIHWPYRTDGPRLFGYRWDESGQWTPWAADSNGVLWSRALGGLGQYIEETPWLRALDNAGRRLPSPEEEAERAQREALRAEQEAARAEREAMRANAAAERAAAAEAELARLRARLAGRDDDTPERPSD